MSDISYCRVDRSEFSELCLTLIDAMCDLARLSGSTQFSEISVIDMANHLVNFYFINFPQSISLDYIDKNSNIDISMFDEKMIGQKITPENFAQFRDFRSAYVCALLGELQASDVIQVGYALSEEGNNMQIYNIKQHMLDRVTLVRRINNVTDKIPTFGLKLLDKRRYINGQLSVTDIHNDHFKVEYGNLELDLTIGLFIYIAIGERYAADKGLIIYTLLKYAEDMLIAKEKAEKALEGIEDMVKLESSSPARG